MYDVQFEMSVSKAIELGDIEVVKELLENDDSKINMIIPRGNWLNVAVAYQQFEIVKYLLEIGIDKNIMSRTGNSIVNAARTGNVEMVEYLLQNGVDLTCTLDMLNPVVLAAQSDRLEMVEYLLDKERQVLSTEQYESLIKLLIEKAEIFSCKRVLKYFGVEKAVKNKVITKTQKNKIIQLIKDGVKECFEGIKEECCGEKIYILSVECEENLSKIYVYMNTVENLNNQLETAEIDMKDQIFYYKYCEDEWYVFDDSPQYFTSIAKYIKEKQITNDDMVMWYGFIVDAICELRKDMFFEQTYEEDVLCTIYGHDVCSEKEISEFFKRMNAGRNCEEYIENMEQFY